MLGMILSLILSGCEQKLPREEQESVTEEKHVTRWDEKWNVVYVDDENNDVEIKMKMNCIIIIPENKPDSIVEVREMEFDSQNKERFVKTLFGDEAYLYDISHMTKEALRRELKDRKENLASCNEYIKNYEEHYSDADGFTAEAKKKRKFLRDTIKSIKVSLKQAPDVPVPVGDGEYDCDSYLGYINGVAYKLEYNGQNSGGMVPWNEGEFEDNQTVTLEPVDSRDVAPKEFASADKLFYYGGHKDIENKCSLTSAEALEAAKDFLRKLGFDNMVETSSEDMVWTDNPDSQAGILEGYRFFLKTGMKGVTFSGQGAYPSPDEKDFAEVCVSGGGVVALRLNAPLEVKSITPDVKLLDFKDIQDMLRTQMADYIKEIIRYEKQEGHTDPFAQFGNEIEIERIELCYCRLEDPEKEGEFAYVPAWKLNNLMLMNAIDGSFIAV